MPLLAAEGLSAERLARLATRVLRVEMTLYDALNAALLKFAPGPWPDQGPVIVDAGEFHRLPDEIGLRMLERIVNWVGNEGPVELGKLEALYQALVGAIDFGPFRRTLAGAVVTLLKGNIRVERAPARRSAPKPP
jgi:tRNA(Ile)-lysidine synthase